MSVLHRPKDLGGHLCCSAQPWLCGGGLCQGLTHRVAPHMVAESKLALLPPELTLIQRNCCKNEPKL